MSNYAHVVKSNKGGVKLEKDGYLFHLERKINEKAFWCCAERKSLKCKARMETFFTNDNYAIKNTLNSHSHAPLAYEKEVAKANLYVKTKAKEALPPSVITRDSIVNTEPICRPHLPSKAAQKMKIHRVRQNLLREPESLELINIPQNLRYIDGELFVLKETTYASGKLILLGTKTAMQMLSEAKCWLVDGTFAVVPSIMRQLFSVHGQLEGTVVPLIYCLMSSKSREAYDEFWTQLLACAGENNIQLLPEVIISDFEQPVIASAQSYFPQARTHGCLFHLGQIIWRRVQYYGFNKKHGDDETFATEIRMLKALAFVPATEVKDYFEAAYINLVNVESKPIYQWFKKYYIGTNSNPPRYPPEFWTTGASAADLHFPRTQNSVEAWHRRLKAVVGKRHAGVYKLVTDLGKESIVAKMTIDKIIRGEEPPKSKIVKKNEILQRVFASRQRHNKVQYLINLAHSLNV